MRHVCQLFFEMRNSAEIAFTHFRQDIFIELFFLFIFNKIFIKKTLIGIFMQFIFLYIIFYILNATKEYFSIFFFDKFV